MAQPIFQDMLNEDNPTSFPSPQGRGDITPAGVYYGPHISHDGFRPEWALLPEESRWTWMTDEALQLAKWVANQVIQVSIHWPTLLEWPAKINDRTYNLAEALHRVWLTQLKKPIPSQEFPAEKAA